MSSMRCYYHPPSKDWNNDVVFGLNWLVHTAKMFPNMQPLLAIEDRRCFDNLLQSTLKCTWDNIVHSHQITRNGTVIRVELRQTIGNPHHNVALVVNPTQSLLEKVEKQVLFLQEFLVIYDNDDLEYIESWVQKNSANRV